MAKTLDHLAFSYQDHTLIGSIKSCLDYLNIDVSDEWLYGMSGVAFIIATDKNVSTNAVAYGYEPGMVYRLVENLGVHVRGIHRVEDPVNRDTLLFSAWEHTKRAIDNGFPCFSFELEEQHEHAIIYGYNKEGYLSHGWHQRGLESIPWQKLGQKLCPCEGCKIQRAEGNVDESARFYDLHWVEPGPKEENVTKAFLQMLDFVFHITDHRDWVYKNCEVGLDAYDNIIQALENGTAIGKHLGYNFDIYAEARSLAPKFLNEVAKEIDGVSKDLIKQAIKAYQTVSERLKEAEELYPWRQPLAPVGINETSQEASQLVKEARDAEKEGLQALREIHHALKKETINQ